MRTAHPADLPLLFFHGFVDAMGPLAGTIQKQYALSGLMAGLLPAFAFVAFAIFSVPGGAGVGVEPDALAWLAAQLGADRVSTRSELEKLALFMGPGGGSTWIRRCPASGTSPGCRWTMRSSRRPRATWRPQIGRWRWRWPRVRRPFRCCGWRWGTCNACTARGLQWRHRKSARPMQRRRYGLRFLGGRRPSPGHSACGRRRRCPPRWLRWPRRSVAASEPVGRMRPCVGTPS